MRVRSRPASGDLVVVAIDPTSLRAPRNGYGRWHHAAAIRRLIEAGAGPSPRHRVQPSSTPRMTPPAAALAARGLRHRPAGVPQLRQTHDRRVEPLDTAAGALLRHASPARSTSNRS
jgi:hypothetical protein